MEYITIGKYLEDLRKAKGESQEELAKAVGVSQSLVDRWEKDKTAVKPSHARRLANHFNSDEERMLKLSFLGKVIQANKSQYRGLSLDYEDYPQFLELISSLEKKCIESAISLANE